MASQAVELGQPPADDAARDAVHVAIIPAVYSSSLGAIALPGDTIAFLGDDTVTLAPEESADGIIDPFLHGTIATGQRVWVLMSPGSVKRLRHTWEHASVGDER